MPKDFSEYISDPSKLSNSPAPSELKDPNIYHNSVVEREIKNKYRTFMISELSQKLATMLLVAPLLTMQVSLQLSVLPHKEKYHDTIQNEKRDIIKSPNPLTVQDKRRYEMVVKSGVTKGNMPFRAPVYSSYREVFKGLSNQGVLGFYKGNLAGSLHLLSSFLIKNYLATWFKFGKEEYFWRKSKTWIKVFCATTAGTICDILVYPILTMQSRFILQNRLPNFSVYKGCAHFVMKHRYRYFTFYQGWKALIPYNFILMLNAANFSKDNIVKGLWIGHNLAAFLTYPLMTVMRRLQCQIDLPGMIPVRYAGVSHCFKLMFLEEGMRGFFRGYPLHFISSNINFALGIVWFVSLSKHYYLTRVD